MRIPLFLLPPLVLLACHLAGPRDDGAEFQRALRVEMERLADELDAVGTPGFAMAVLRNGEPVEMICRGIADGEGTPVTPETNFRLASVTKQFTAMAVLLLRGRGALSLDDMLDGLFPELPSHVGETVTVRQLLTHTSGMIAYESLIPDEQTEQVHDSDVLALLATQHGTYFTPGTDYRYSNTGYALLALTVERLSGQTFAQFLRDEIFEPLDMEGSVAFQESVSTVPHRAFGFAISGETVVPRDQSRTSAVLGDGGIYCSLADYAKWDAALRNATLLSREAIDEAMAPHASIGDGAFYGYGWRIEEIDGVTRVHHSGSTCGFRNGIQRLPESGWTVVVLTNLADAPAPDVAEALADWLTEHAPGV